MKKLSIILIIGAMTSQAWALKIQDSSFPLPKITYKGLESMGLDDSRERATKDSLRELLNDPQMATTLRSRTDVDSRTYSLVQEIDLEKKNWNIRLIKNKARVAIINFTKKHWAQLVRSTVNHSGTDDFEQFAGLLKRDLKEKLHIEAHNDKFIIFNMKWAKIKVDKNATNAHIIVQQDYLGDNNDLIDTAYSVRTDPTEKKPERKQQPSRESRDSDGIPKTGIFAF